MRIHPLTQALVVLSLLSPPLALADPLVIVEPRPLPRDPTGRVVDNVYRVVVHPAGDRVEAIAERVVELDPVGLVLETVDRLLGEKPEVRPGDSDCTYAEVEGTSHGAEARTDYERCTPTVEEDPGIQPICDRFSQECCRRVGAECASWLLDSAYHELNNEWLQAFCLGAGHNGTQPLVKAEVGRSCNGLEASVLPLP